MEKYNILVVLFSISLFSCDNNFVLLEQEVSIPCDVSCKDGNMTYLNNACKGDGFFYLNYCDHFFQISEDLTDVKLLADCNGWMRDNDEMLVRNDSLLISSVIDNGDLTYLYEYYDHVSAKWTIIYSFDKLEVEHRFEKQFEDEVYNIYFSNREEGIGYLLFEEKKSGVEHVFKVYQFVKLLCFQGSYYIIGRRSIEKITNSFSQVDNIYSTPEDVSIISGLIIDNDIYILANNSIETYIAKLDVSRLVKIKDFGNQLHFSNYSRFNLGYSTRQDQIFLPYYQDVSGKSGFVDINKYKIRIINLE